NGKAVAVLTFAGPEFVGGAPARGRRVPGGWGDRARGRGGREHGGDGGGGGGGGGGAGGRRALRAGGAPRRVPDDEGAAAPAGAVGAAVAAAAVAGVVRLGGGRLPRLGGREPVPRLHPRLDQLQGHLPLDRLGLASQVNRPHPALADQFGEGVPAGDHAPDRF